MARVTVEDCLDNVENLFDLVLKASARARQLAVGSAESTLDWENDKPTVMALREIAAGCNFNEPEQQDSGEIALEQPDQILGKALVQAETSEEISGQPKLG